MESNLEKLKNTTLLLVEDEDLIRTFMHKMVIRHFKNVFVARDGAEGLELFKKENPDMVLTDINMPIMSGLEMSKAIKEINLNTPIVIASAYYDQDILLKAIDVGVDKYLTKPIKKETLLNTLVTATDFILKTKILEAKNLYIKILFDANPDIVIVSNGTYLINANKSFFEFFKEFNNVKKFREKYSCISDVFVKVDKYGYVYKDINNQNWIEYILNGKRENYKAVIKRDKKYFVFVLSVKKIETMGKIEYIVNLTDITSIENYKKKLEQKIQKEIEENRAKDELMFHQSRLAQMGEMINMIAHQWRQPLNVITSVTIDISLESELESLTPAILEEGLKNIEMQSQKMSSTIDDFMNFFKPNKEKEKFKFIDLFNDIKNLIDAQFQYREIEFIVEVDENLEYLGHKNELEQVLLNLINNARDAFDDKEIEKKIVKVLINRVKDKFFISIEDSAGGVPKNIIDKVFNPYFTTKEEGKGTGIGLYMSKNILERSFNGSIEVENSKNDGGNGAKFTIII